RTPSSKQPPQACSRSETGISWWAQVLHVQSLAKRGGAPGEELTQSSPQELLVSSASSLQWLLEREDGWLRAGGDPLPLRKLIQARIAAEASTVPGSAHPTERNERLVVHRLVIDVDQATAQAFRDGKRARLRAALNGSRKTIFSGVGNFNGLFIA